MGLDYWTKMLAESQLVGSPRVVFANFFGVSMSLTYVTNTGGPWGAFSDYPMPLLVVRLALIAFLVFYLIKNKSLTLQCVAISLVLGGAFGNILDVILHGYVIDMVKFVLWGYHYPVFNIADAAICCGIGLLIINGFQKRRHAGV